MYNTFENQKQEIIRRSKIINDNLDDLHMTDVTSTIRYEMMLSLHGRVHSKGKLPWYDEYADNLVYEASKHTDELGKIIEKCRSNSEMLWYENSYLNKMLKNDLS